MTFRIALCLVVAALAIGLRAQATDRVAAGRGARQVAERIRALQSESDRLAGEARAMLADLRKLEAERDLQIRLVGEAQDAIAQGQAAIEDTAQRVLGFEAQRIAELPALETQLVDTYKRGRAGYARFVLSAGGIRDLGRATRAAAAMLRVSQERVARYRGTIEALGQELVKLESELDVRKAREADALRARAASDRAVADHSALLTRIDSQRDINARLAGELQVEHARLEQQETTRVATANTPAVSAPPLPGPSAPDGSAIGLALTPFAPLKGSLLWPVSGRLTGRFGRRLAAQDSSTAANGVEVASREGNPVRALHTGTVSFAGPSADLGNLVIVDHGGNTLSVYGYLGSVSVSRDAMVASGTELGRVGLGPAGGATLFLEIRIDGRSVDPVQWLRPR